MINYIPKVNITPITFWFIKDILNLTLEEYLLYIYFLSNRNTKFKNSEFNEILNEVVFIKKIKMEEALNNLIFKRLIEIEDSNSKTIEFFKFRKTDKSNIKVKTNKQQFKEACDNWKNKKNQLEIEFSEIHNKISDLEDNKLSSSFEIDYYDNIEFKRLDSNYEQELEEISDEIKLLYDKIKQLEISKKDVKAKYEQDKQILEKNTIILKNKNVNIKSKIENIAEQIRELNIEKKDIINKLYILDIENLDINQNIRNIYKINLDTFSSLQKATNIKTSNKVLNNYNYILLNLIIAHKLNNTENEILISQKQFSKILNISELKIKELLVNLQESSMLTFQYLSNIHLTKVTVNWNYVVQILNVEGLKPKIGQENNDSVKLDFIPKQDSSLKEYRKPSSNKNLSFQNNDEYNTNNQNTNSIKKEIILSNLKDKKLPDFIREQFLDEFQDQYELIIED